jgi:hypothetical protein
MPSGRVRPVPWMVNGRQYDDETAFFGPFDRPRPGARQLPGFPEAMAVIALLAAWSLFVSKYLAITATPEFKIRLVTLERVAVRVLAVAAALAVLWVLLA